MARRRASGAAAVVDAVGGKIPVLMDGGVRRAPMWQT
jgi:isopentenyl diphosphate isomerase/L-lactate dehydrogenase-like FMN-dependent dehydrogenase